MDLGIGEIVVILAIVLLLFGPSKLPQLGESIGRGLRNFRKAVSGAEEPGEEARPRVEEPARRAVVEAERSEPAAPAPLEPAASAPPRVASPTGAEREDAERSSAPGPTRS